MIKTDKCGVWDDNMECPIEGAYLHMELNTEVLCNGREEVDIRRYWAIELESMEDLVALRKKCNHCIVLHPTNKWLVDAGGFPDTLHIDSFLCYMHIS